MEAIIENLFNLEVARRTLPVLLKGLLATARLVGVSFAIALVLGVAVASARRSERRWVRRLSEGYIDVARGLPPLVSLVVVFYLVPPIGGYTLTSFQAAALTFGLVQAAYVGEIYRGGLAAVQHGHREAAMSLGLRPVHVALFVVIPQVVRVIIPPLTNQLTQLVRDSALAFFIGYSELITRARQMSSLTSNSTPYITAALLYVSVLVPLQILSRHLEKRRSVSTGY